MGETRGHVAAGAVLGGLLGPVGWLITLAAYPVDRRAFKAWEASRRNQWALTASLSKNLELL